MTTPVCLVFSEKSLNMEVWNMLDSVHYRRFQTANPGINKEKAQYEMLKKAWVAWIAPLFKYSFNLLLWLSAKTTQRDQNGYLRHQRYNLCRNYCNHELLLSFKYFSVLLKPFLDERWVKIQNMVERFQPHSRKHPFSHIEAYWLNKHVGSFPIQPHFGAALNPRWQCMISKYLPG